MKRTKSAPPLGEELSEEINPAEFVAGRKSKEQACHEDPNCRELERKKKNTVHVAVRSTSLNEEELEEVSTVGGAAAGERGNIEGYSSTGRRKRKKHKQDEQLVNDVVNYLLKSRN